MSLEIRQAVKKYQSVHALDHAQLEIARGQIGALLGASGSGKTTLLHAIAGLVRLDSGTIRWNSATWQDGKTFVAPEKRKVGMVFQDFALFPHLTAQQNIEFGLRAHHWPRSKMTERVDELLALVHLKEYRTRFPHELSGGQKQRVAVARALAPAPSLLLMDESLSSLDASLRRALQDELRTLFHQLSITVVMVTHDPQEAMAMADYLVVMDKGQAVAHGSSSDLYHRPLNVAMAQLLGPCTLWEGHIAHYDDAYATVQANKLSFRLPLADPVSGNRVTLCLRPESISIPSNAKLNDHVVMPVDVISARFEHGRYLVQAQSPAGLTVFYSDHPPSDRTEVTFNPAQCAILPATP